MIHRSEMLGTMAGVGARLPCLALIFKGRSPSLREAAHFTTTIQNHLHRTPANERSQQEATLTARMKRAQHNRTNTLNLPKPPGPRFESDLRESPDIMTTLKLVEDAGVDVEAAVNVLRHLRQLVQRGEEVDMAGRAALLNGTGFEQLTQVLHNQVQQITLPNLLSSVESLLIMSADDLFLTTSLETQTIWLLKSMAFNDIIKVILLHKDHQETDLRKKVLQHALDQVDQRCAEIVRPQDLVTLMYIVSVNNKALLSKLEMRALDISDSMSAKDMFRMLSLLSQRKRRNKALVQKVVTVMAGDDVELGIAQVQNLLYSCINLHIFDVAFLRKLTDVIMTSGSSAIDTPQVAAGLLQSFSTLRWRDEPLLDMLARVIIDNVVTATTQDFMALLLTSANLNFLPKALASQFDEVVLKLKVVADQNHRQWVDVVWNCAVLKQHTAKMVNHILDPKFTDSLQGKEPAKVSHADITAIKLRNLFSVAQCEVTGYTGPSASEQRMKVPVRLNRMTLGTVIKALTNLAPADKYLHFDVPHLSGFNIDIELSVDSSGRPIAKKAEPEAGAHRLAFKVLEFSDMSVGPSVQPSGLHSMAIRHLDYHGYKVIPVPYTDVQEIKTEVEMVQYLKTKILEAVGTNQAKA